MTGPLAAHLGLAVVLSALVVEVVLRLPFAAVLAQLRRTLARALAVLRFRAVSEHWKEKAMLAYARAMLAGSLGLAGLLLAVAGAAAGFVFAAGLFQPSFEGFIVGLPGLAVTVIAAGLYLTARRVFLHGRLRLSRPPAPSPRAAVDAGSRAQLRHRSEAGPQRS